MDALKAFGKAMGSEIVLDPESKVISDELKKFHAFRSLVDSDQIPNYDSLVLHWHVSENSAPDAGKVFSAVVLGKTLPIVSEKRIVRDDLFQLIDETDRDIMMACYDLIGVDGAIEIVKGKEDRIDVFDSYRFEMGAAVDVSSAFRPQARVLLIDGFVENVSEIHHVLQKASEVKDCLLIFARGFSPDVLNTLSVNNLRQTLDVIPFSIPLEQEHINDFYDLEMLTGCQTISNEKGQVISSTKFESLPAVTHVKYSPVEKMLAFRNESTKAQARVHLKKLREKLETSDAHNVSETVARIRRMTGLISMLSLRDDSIFDIRKSRLKRASRLIDHFARFGAVVTPDGTYPKSSWMVAERHAEDYLRQARDSVILRF